MYCIKCRVGQSRHTMAFRLLFLVVHYVGRGVMFGLRRSPVTEGTQMQPWPIAASFVSKYSYSIGDDGHQCSPYLIFSISTTSAVRTPCPIFSMVLITTHQAFVSDSLLAWRMWVVYGRPRWSLYLSFVLVNSTAGT